MNKSRPSPESQSGHQRRARLHVDAPLATGGTVNLGKEQAARLYSVLRLKAGAEVLLFNGRDGEWLGVIGKISKSVAEISITSQLREQAGTDGPWLAFAPLKKSRLDMVVEKSVELGATRLLPVITERTENRRVNTARLRLQVVEAAEQCERMDIPVVDEPLVLDRLPGAIGADVHLLVCAERRGALSASEVIQGLSGQACILVGPEGGFATHELDWLEKQPNSHAMGLGPRILRAETAAIAALSIWQSIKGWGPG